MKRFAALVIVLSCLAASPATAKPREVGGTNSIALVDRRGGRQDTAIVTPPGRAVKPGKPRIVERGKGDRPPTPSLVWVTGFGPCVTGGGSILMTDPLIAVPVPYLTCPGPARAAGGAPAAPPPPPTPIEAAYQAWYWQTTLPSPTLTTSPPNGAVTGLDLYLSIGGAQTQTFDIPALGYTVHLVVSSVYDINWGDPKPDDTPLGHAVTKGHTTQGGPYPDGDLRHQYISRGQAKIEVTQRWKAEWSAGGETGTIADRLGTSASLTIPIQEIQAVLTRP